MSSSNASENTRLLPGPSTPVPDEYGKREILIGVLAHIAFLLSSSALSFFAYYTLGGGKTIFDISDENPTCFTIRRDFVSWYWFILLLLQMRYLNPFSCMTVNTEMRCQKAARLGIFFILHNILTFVWSFLFIHSLFKWSESILFLNLIQLCIGCVMDRKSRLGRGLQREREIPADQESRGSQEAQLITCWYWGEFNFINRLAVLSLPLTLTVYMLPWNIAIDFTCQESICSYIAIATVPFLLVYGLVFIRLRDSAVGLASSFLSIGLLMQQWDNSNRWYFWAIVVNAAVTGIYSICVAKAQYDGNFRRYGAAGFE